MLEKRVVKAMVYKLLLFVHNKMNANQKKGPERNERS